MKTSEAVEEVGRPSPGVSQQPSEPQPNNSNETHERVPGNRPQLHNVHDSRFHLEDPRPIIADHAFSQNEFTNDFSAVHERPCLQIDAPENICDMEMLPAGNPETEPQCEIIDSGRETMRMPRERHHNNGFQEEQCQPKMFPQDLGESGIQDITESNGDVNGLGHSTQCTEQCDKNVKYPRQQQSEHD
jgi:hypothetical protein